MWVAELAEFGSPETAVRLTEHPDPGDPGAGEVVIAAEYAPINPADLLNLQGLYGAERPELPLIPGTEGVGRVMACGADVTQVKAGDRVLLQLLQGDELQRGRMRRLQDDGRRDAGHQRLLPPRDAEAPAVARLQTGEVPLRVRRREVVAAGLAEGEERLGHLARARPGEDRPEHRVIRRGQGGAIFAL